jgi:hypothetical protein
MVRAPAAIVAPWSSRGFAAVDPGEGATSDIHRPLWTLVMNRVDLGEQQNAQNQRVGLVIPWT